MPEEKLIFHAEQISVLRLNSMYLLMDREMGRFCYIPEHKFKIARLIFTEDQRLTPKLILLKKQIQRELLTFGLGKQWEEGGCLFNTLILKVTGKCNFSCSYCYNEDNIKSQTMEVDMALEAIRQALTLCGQGLQIVFHGGEPFTVFDHIKQIVLGAEKMALQCGKRIRFQGQTNMGYLDDDSVAFSQQHRIYWGISLDGPAAINDQFRHLKNGKGTYSLVEKMMQRYPDFVRGSYALVTVTSAVQHYLLEISHYFKACGLRGWNWTLFQPVGRGRAHPEIQVDLAPLLESWNKLFDAVLKGDFDGFMVEPILKYLDNFLEGPGKSMCMRRPCGAARDLLVISPEGQIDGCDCFDTFAPWTNLGNIKTLTLAEARNSQKAQIIRSRNLRGGKCGQCIWFAICGGTCLAYSSELNGVWDIECQLAANALEHISLHLADSKRLIEYKKSCTP